MTATTTATPADIKCLAVADESPVRRPALTSYNGPSAVELEDLRQYTSVAVYGFDGEDDPMAFGRIVAGWLDEPEREWIKNCLTQVVPGHASPGRRKSVHMALKLVDRAIEAAKIEAELAEIREEYGQELLEHLIHGHYGVMVMRTVPPLLTHSQIAFYGRMIPAIRRILAEFDALEASSDKSRRHGPSAERIRRVRDRADANRARAAAGNSGKKN